MTKHSRLRRWGILGGLSIGLVGAPMLAHGREGTEASAANSEAGSPVKNDDNSITNRVKQNLAMTGSEGKKIDVDTDHGVVTLSGTVNWSLTARTWSNPPGAPKE